MKKKWEKREGMFINIKENACTIKQAIIFRGQYSGGFRGDVGGRTPFLEWKHVKLIEHIPNFNMPQTRLSYV